MTMTKRKKMFVIRAFESSPHKPILLSFYDKIEYVTGDKISKPVQNVSSYMNKTLQKILLVLAFKMKNMHKNIP